MDIIYIRDDIYYCPSCGEFYDLQTEERVKVPYTEMPAEVALQVMIDRQQPFKLCHRRRRLKRAKKIDKGFTK